MLHQMKLLEKPFDNIKKGTKTVEFRLYDEKRRKIKIGDKIEFSKLPELKEKIIVKVIDLYQEKSFKELFEKVFINPEDVETHVRTIYNIYSEDEERKYGVLGIKMKLDTEELRNEIENYEPYNEQEEKDKLTMLKYIDNFDDVLTRQNEFGHFTASSWVVNKERTKVLMIYHNIYQSWAWTGGHADGESNLLNVALREVKEETGIEYVKPIQNNPFSVEIACVNGHIKRGKYVSSHVHLNVTYLLEADESEELKVKEDENSGVKWVDIDKAVELSNEDWMRYNIYQKLNDKVKKLK